VVEEEPVGRRAKKKKKRGVIPYRGEIPKDVCREVGKLNDGKQGRAHKRQMGGTAGLVYGHYRTKNGKRNDTDR